MPWLLCVSILGSIASAADPARAPGISVAHIRFTGVCFAVCRHRGYDFGTGAQDLKTCYCTNAVDAGEATEKRLMVPQYAPKRTNPRYWRAMESSESDASE